MKKTSLLSMLLILLFIVPANLLAQPKVIAHRGYWTKEGSAENSISSLRNAAEIGCYGSEFDVNVTEDGIPVINHDGNIGEIVIAKSPYSAIADITLPNGEKLPTLKEYLTEGKKYPEMKMILEIKSAYSPEAERKATDAIMQLVEEMGVKKQVEYIAFSLNVTLRILENDAKAKVSYLNGDLPPYALKKLDIFGLDYYIQVMRNHPEWIADARKNKIHMNIWTVDDPEDIQFVIDCGADYITTNQPVRAQKMIADQYGK